MIHVSGTLIQDQTTISVIDGHFQKCLKQRMNTTTP